MLKYLISERKVKIRSLNELKYKKLGEIKKRVDKPIHMNHGEKPLVKWLIYPIIDL